MGSRNLGEDSGSFLKEIGARARHMLGGICDSLLNTADGLRKNVPKGSRNSEVTAEAQDHDVDGILIQTDPQGSEWQSDLVRGQPDEQTIVQADAAEEAEPLFEELYAEAEDDEEIVQVEAEATVETVFAEAEPEAAEVLESAEVVQEEFAVDTTDEPYYDDFLPPMKDAERRAPRVRETVVEETTVLVCEEKVVDITEIADIDEDAETEEIFASVSEEAVETEMIAESAVVIEEAVIDKHVNVFIDLGEDVESDADVEIFEETVEAEATEDVVADEIEVIVDKHVNVFIDLGENVTETVAAEPVEILEEAIVIETVETEETFIEAGTIEAVEEIAEPFVEKHVNVFIDLGDDVETESTEIEAVQEISVDSEVFEAFVSNIGTIDIEAVVTSMDEGIAMSLAGVGAPMAMPEALTSEDVVVVAEDIAYEPSLADVLPKELIAMFDSEDAIATEYAPVQKYVNVRIVFNSPLESAPTMDAEITEEIATKQINVFFDIENAEAEIAAEETVETVAEYAEPIAIEAADEVMLISEFASETTVVEKQINVFFDLGETAEAVPETVAEAVIQKRVNVTIDIDDDEPVVEMEAEEEETFITEVQEVHAAAEAAPVGGVGFSFASFGKAGGSSISFTWGREPEEEIDAPIASESTEADVVSFDEGVYVSPVSGKENLWL